METHQYQSSFDERLVRVPEGRHVRVPGRGTFFVRDPSGNALEFKTFRDMQRLFQAEG